MDPAKGSTLQGTGRALPISFAEIKSVALSFEALYSVKRLAGPIDPESMGFLRPRDSTTLAAELIRPSTLDLMALSSRVVPGSASDAGTHMPSFGLATRPAITLNSVTVKILDIGPGQVDLYPPDEGCPLVGPRNLVCSVAVGVGSPLG